MNPCTQRTDTNRNLLYRVSRIGLLAAIALIAVLGSGCDSGPNDEGGVIGTGIILRGTTSTPRTIATNRVLIKGLDGETFSASLGAGNRFLTDQVSGDGPWVLRADLGGGLSIYGISFGNNTSNINSYSDVILRNWFARRGTDLDSAFNNNGPFDALPSQGDYETTASNLFSLLDLLFESNAVQGNDLLSGDFAADNRGIDSFLNANPVVIDNGLVSVLITDPDSDTQSLMRSELQLDTDYGRPDSQAPTVPGAVRALGSASNEIVVVWDPSVDDLAVQGYQVFRDDVFVDSTPYPVYVDTEVGNNTTASYEITAFDASGNTSSRSVSATGTTLGAPDSSPPAAPSALVLLEASISRVDLIWGQNNVADLADVARFNLYRGTESDNLPFLVTVTSTFATDTSISSPGTYCYQVSAEDTSGNESSRSDVLCADIGGAQSNDTSNTGNNTGNTNSQASYIELNVPDTDSLSCEQSLQPDDLSSTITLSPACYTVAENLLVPPFTKLSISAGTVLKFAAGTKLTVGRDASMTVNGTVDAPVVFTGAQTGIGYWGGIEFNRSNSSLNLLRNAVIEYAGSDEFKGAVVVDSRDNDRTRIRIENSLIRFSGNYGLDFVTNETIIESFFGNRVTRNFRPAAFNADLLESVAGSSDFTGNDRDEIVVLRNTFSKDIVITDLGVPYLWGGMTVTNGSVEIKPGVTMRLFGNAEIRVDGSFKAVGNETSPINFVGEDQEPGSWRGLYLLGREDKEIAYANIADAGVPGDANGAIRLECSTAIPTQLSLSNSEIAGSASWAVALSPNGCTLDLGPGMTYFNNVLGEVNNP